MVRILLISRAALAVALGAGLAGVALPPAVAARDKPAAGAKIAFSPAFSKAAAEFDKALSDASKNPAVSAAAAKAKAANTPAERQTAVAEVDAALGGAGAKLAAIAAAASTPGDKLKLGEMTYRVGVLSGDPATLHKGAAMMLDSGVAAPEQTGQLQYLAGVTSYQTGDYAGAIQYLRPSFESGYRDQGGMIEKVLADAYKRTNNSGAALELSNRALAAAKAAGGKPSEDAIRTPLQAAYDSKNLVAASDLSADLVRYYPSSANWKTAVLVVRSLGSLPPQENLDLLRLMTRTNAMADRNDYLEYVQTIGSRRFPGETLKVIDAGRAVGKLSATDAADDRAIASAKVAADRASLPGLEREARGTGASAETITAIADAFLSYEQPAKAEELYKLALAKPGVDRNRAMMRIGIAQTDQGRFADAQASFAQVSGGSRAQIAKLWTAYAASRASGATAS